MAAIGSLAIATTCWSGLEHCTDEETTVFKQFPQYGDLNLEPVSELAGCAAFYRTPDGPEHLLAYLVERLEAGGWTVEPAAGGQLESRPGGDLLRAYRDGFLYQVGFERLGFYTPAVSESMRNGTHVAVHVGLTGGN